MGAGKRHVQYLLHPSREALRRMDLIASLPQRLARAARLARLEVLEKSLLFSQNP